MISKLLKILPILILIQACGFKVQDQSSLKKFFIKKIEAKGDNRVNFNIKNKLFLKSGSKNKRPLNLTIDTIKTKNIKEKDDKNIITKYVIRIDLKIVVEVAGVNKKVFNLTDERDFNVGNQYSQTIRNEKQAIEDVTDSLIDKIIRELSTIKLNDT